MEKIKFKLSLLERIKKSWWSLKRNYYHRQNKRFRKKEFYWVDIYFGKIRPKRYIERELVSNKIDVLGSIATSYRTLEKVYEMKIESLDKF